jgi:hypothetical protein
VRFDRKDFEQPNNHSGVVVEIMKKGIVSVSLYLTVIIISIFMGFQEHAIIGLMWAGFAGLSFIVGLFMTNWAIKRNPELHQSLDPNSKEHIIMPILYLIILFSGNIVWLFWPEIGAFMISSNSIYFAITVPFSSLALGEIHAYTRFHTTTDETVND